MFNLLWTLLAVLHVIVCAILMFVVLLQQGKGGGMGAAFGGGAAAQVFGGRGAGNLLTRATGVCAGLFMVTSMSLAYHSSDHDRGLKARQAAEEQKRAEKGTARPKEAVAPATSAESEPAGSANAPAETAPTNGPAETPPSSNPEAPAPPAPAPSK
jgi:preprotein translocase subunit SecG